MSPSAPYRALVDQVLGELARQRLDVAPQITSWIEAVASWNQQMDLTAARDDRELVDLMVADAALLAEVLGPSPGDGRRTVIDVGSGAGAPGLPLGLLRPDFQVSLVEPKQKRAALLRMTVGRLGTLAPAATSAAGGPSIQVIQTRGEVVKERFDVALSRATLSPPAWLALGAKLAPEGEVWVLLAREAAPALDGWRQAAAVDYQWPLTGVARSAVRYRRD